MASAIAMEYGHKYGGTSFELFAQISEKNHGHSTLNPLAAYTKRMSLEEIMSPPYRAVCAHEPGGRMATWPSLGTS